MAAPQTPPLASVLLLAFFVLHPSSSLPPCPQSCICKSALLLNCSSASLLMVPRLLQDSVTELDLSHNLLSSLVLHQPHPNLRNVWLGNNSITYLSLCIETNFKDPHLRHHFRTQGRTGCQVWGPALQLLSAERNLLEQLPEGLDGVRSLEVLQLSFNRISTLKPGVLTHLRQLKELHLQHNLITHLYPQMFQDLDQLRVLDLRFNMLASLHPLMYLTLRTVGTDVQLDGNKWQCNCIMRSLQRRMAYDSSRGLQVWSIVCTFPSRVLGRDLLQLQEEDFYCSGTENRQDLHQDVTVYSGSEILLSCSAQDSMMWTPSDKGSVSQQNAGRLISDVSDSNTGLYVCVSEENQVVSVFNLQISKTGGARKSRSLPKSHSSSPPQNAVNRVGEVKTQYTESDLALAVCLSVFITFLLAFIVGVLARPLIDMLCKRIAKKKSPTATHTEQRPYDNEAFSDGEEQEDPGPFRERRVTFSTVDFIEDSNVQSYDTVASGDQERNSRDAVIECEVSEAEHDDQTAGDSGSEHLCHNSSENKQSCERRTGDSNEKTIHHKEFEHIPDPSELEERRSMSSCSDSSFSEKISEDQLIKRQHVGRNSPQLAEDSVQQTPDFSTKTEVTQISMEGKKEIIGISSGPSLHTKINNSLDSDNEDCDNEELFEFSDSAESGSRVFDSYDNLQQSQGSTSDRKKMEGMSSSSSYISEDEPTHYNVNSDRDVDQDGNYDSSSSSDSKNETICYTKQQGRDDVHMTRPPSKGSQTVTNVTENQWPSVILGQKIRIKRRLDIKAPSQSSDSYSSNENGDDIKSCVKKQEQEVLYMSRPPIKVSQTVKQENQWPTIDLGKVTRFKRRLDVKAPSTSSDSSCSSDSENENKRHIKYEDNDVQLSRPLTKTSQVMLEKPENQWPIVDLEQRTRIKRRIDIKASSPSSDLTSSSDSEDSTKGYIKELRQEEVHMTRTPSKTSQTVTKMPKNQWPSVDLGQKRRIKRRLDIKAPSQSSDSISSSNSEDETTDNVKRQEQAEVHMLRHSIKEPQTEIIEPGNQWPIVDLEQLTQVKRRIDIKASSQSYDSSFNKDEGHAKGHVVKQEQEKVHISRPPVKVSQTVTELSENEWPSVDLVQVTQIKRHLAFKAPSPSFDFSSNSESENETTSSIQKQGQEEVYISQYPGKVSQTMAKENPENQWPTVTLGRIMIKRRLDIKAPRPLADSSSGSDSDDEITGHIQKKGHEEVHISQPPVKIFQTVTEKPYSKWPTVDFRRLPQIKRRLDIKGPSHGLDSSSSRESKNETKSLILKQEHDEVQITNPPIKVSQTITKVPHKQWPVVDIEQITHIKRRLDFKGPSPSTDSSSNSHNKDDTKGYIKEQKEEEIHISRSPIKESKVPENYWPTIGLEQIKIKRRLDIKPPSQSSDSSSSNESDEETKSHSKYQEQELLQMSRPPIKLSQTTTNVPENQWPTVHLGQVTQIKRRLDFKGPSHSSILSSSSHTDDETKGYTQRLEQEKVHMPRSPIKASQTLTKVPENQWPTIDLGQIKIKRRLDIKASSSISNSASSSDKEDERKVHTHGQDQLREHMVLPPMKVPQTLTEIPEKQRQTVDLGQITQIKRRLDFKGPSLSSGSSSSTHNKDETKGYIEEKKVEEVHISKSPIKVSKVPENYWPTIGLEQIKIKRRLDIKPPSQSSDSSSSNESDEETKCHSKYQEQEMLQMSRPPIKLSQTTTNLPENQWPTVHLGQVTQIKRRLDFKGPSQSSILSSNSHTDDETKSYTQRLEQEKVHMPRSPIKASQTLTKVPENQWPTIDLGQIKIKRRLDIKASSSISNSALSSDKEDERKVHTHGQDQVREHMVLPLMKVPQTLTEIPEKQRQTVDLGQITQIKRRLDFKGPSLSSGSSSSTHNKDETKGYIEEKEEEEVHISKSPIKVSKVPENSWPTIGLEQIKIKRRLDIKPPSQSSDSSSSNESDEEIKSHSKYQEQEVLQMSRPPIKLSQTTTNVPENQWPTVHLGQVTQIKRRLDFKGPSLSSGSSSSTHKDETKGCIEEKKEDEVHISKSPIKVSTVTKVPENYWPTVGLEQIKIKRRLDIKAPFQSSDSPSVNKNDDQIKSHLKSQEQEVLHMSKPPINVLQTTTKVPENHWPTIGLEQIKIRRSLDVKAPTPGFDSSSSSEQGVGMTMSSITQSVTKVSENQWPVIDLEDVTQIKRRLDFKAPSPWSPSSRCESENEDRDLQARVKMDYSALSTTSEDVKSSDVPVMNIFHTPRKDYNIKLEKYSVIPDHLENKPTNDTIDVTPDINPELQTRWATMNLGISRFRKRLEITPSTTEPHSLSSPYPEHSSNTETRPGGRPRLHRKIVEMQGKDSSPVLENKTQNVSITLKDPYHKYTSLGNKEPNVTEQKTELDTTLSGFGSQHTEMYEDIWVGEKASTTASQQQPYTFSKIDSKRSVPDLSFGVPRIKRRLDIKAPCVESSYASSFINKSEKDVKEYSKMQSRQISTVQETTDDSLITYKRSIIKQSSPLSWNSPRDRNQTAENTFVTLGDDRNASLVPRTGQSVSFDHIVNRKISQSRSNTDVDLLDEIRWTGVGHHLSDLSEASLKAITVTQPQSPPHDISSSTSVNHKMQDNGKSDATLMSKYSSLDTKGVSHSSSDSPNMFGISPLRTNESTETVSEDRQKRGLGALKAMSLERKLWETDYGKNPSASSDGLQDDTQFDYGLSKRGIDVLPKEPLKHLPSASVEKRKDADLLLLLYGVPRYKGHGIKDPLQEAPPPLPETPPPDD